MAERFGALPWWLEEEDADKVLYYFNVMAAEASARSLLEGLPRTERLIRQGD